jgi:hypothetical protein
MLGINEWELIDIQSGSVRDGENSPKQEEEEEERKERKKVLERGPP